MHDRRRDLIANTLIVTGAVLFSIGAGLAYLPAGFVVAGVLCIVGGYLLARNN